MTQMPRTNFRCPYSRRLHIKFGFDRASDFGEEGILNCGRRRRTYDDVHTYDGQTPEHGYPISSPMSLRSGEQKCERTDERTTEHGYTISSPCEPDGSGELKS